MSTRSHVAYSWVWKVPPPIRDSTSWPVPPLLRHHDPTRPSGPQGGTTDVGEEDEATAVTPLDTLTAELTPPLNAN